MSYCEAFMTWDRKNKHNTQIKYSRVRGGSGVRKEIKLGSALIRGRLQNCVFSESFVCQRP